MKQSEKFREVFRIFQNKSAYFEDADTMQSNRLIWHQLIVICVFTFIYGAVMGSYHSGIQSLAAGIKLVALFVCAILICFPSFFIIQQVLGSSMSIRQMIVIVLSGMVLTATIALSFSPIILFFQFTGGNYHFLQLLHVAVFIFAGVFGLRLMVDALKFACEQKAIYPQVGVTVFKIWIVILAFVSIQLSWNLRPFLANKTEEFKMFRDYEGNFYTAIVYSFEQIFSDKVPKKEDRVYLQDSDSTIYTADSTVNKTDSITAK